MAGLMLGMVAARAMPEVEGLAWPLVWLPALASVAASLAWTLLDRRHRTTVLTMLRGRRYRLTTAELRAASHGILRAGAVGAGAAGMLALPAPAAWIGGGLVALTLGSGLLELRSRPGDERSIPRPARRRPALALAVACLMAALLTTDHTKLNVALVGIATDLEAGPSDLAWVVDGFLLAQLALLLVAGSIADRFGRRRVLAGGAVLFVLGSLGAALSSTPTELIAARVAQGAGGAAMLAASFVLVQQEFPEPGARRRAYLGWTLVYGLGLAVGPMIGGAAVEMHHWSAMFYVDVPLGILVLAGTARLSSSAQRRSGRLDLVGLLLVTAGLIVVVWGLVEAPARGWSDSLVLRAFASGMLALVLFVLWERRAPHPMIRIDWFARARFSVAFAALAATYFMLMGALVLVSMYLQEVVGREPLATALQLQWVALGLLLGSVAARFAVKGIWPAVALLAGLVLMSTASFLMASITVETGIGFVAAVLVITGAGMGLAIPAAVAALQDEIPADAAGAGSALNHAGRLLGGALGVAVMWSITMTAYAPAIDKIELALPDLARARARDGISGANAVADALPADAETLRAAARVAFVDSIGWPLVIAGGLVAVAALLSVWLLIAAVRTRRHTAAPGR
jgi:EmrB/QacA subfamily drug resistance transporter